MAGSERHELPHLDHCLWVISDLLPKENKNCDERQVGSGLMTGSPIARGVAGHRTLATFENDRFVYWGQKVNEYLS